MAVDYKEFKKKPALSGNVDKKFASSSVVDNYSPGSVWWIKEDEYDLLNSAKQMIGLLSTDLLSRMIRYRIETRLYGITDFFANIQKSYNQSYNVATVVPERLSHNVTQSNIDTLLSKMSKIRPRAKFLTNLGTFKAQKAAKKLGYFTDGIFAENDLYALSHMIIRDTLVLGDGIVHVYSENNRVKLERVLPYELLVDELECVGNKPTHMYRIKLVDRYKLMELYPDKRDAIFNSQQFFTVNVHQASQVSNQIEVLEAWHKETVEGAGDGKHVLAVPACVLVDEEWNGKDFPFARLSWTRPFSGYWSQSLAEQLKPIQMELNKLLAVLQRSYHLAGSFKILVQNGSQIPVESLNNNIGTIIKFTGAKPEYITPPILPPEFYRQIQTLIDRSYQISGVSSLSATSQKPAGLNSGVALREYSDIESSRFTAFSQEVEQWFVDIAKLCVEQASIIAEKNGGHYPVNRPGPKSLNKIDFAEIKLDKENYTVTVFPASNLPNEPAGRLAAIDDLVQRGLIDPTEQRELLNMPDIEASNQLATAQDEYLKETLEKMLEEGVYTAPEPYDNLQLARKLALQYYALGKSLTEDEGKLELIRQFIRDLNALEAPEPVIPNLPQPELGAQIAPQEAGQLALPAATAPLPMAQA